MEHSSLDKSALPHTTSFKKCGIPWKGQESFEEGRFARKLQSSLKAAQHSFKETVFQAKTFIYLERCSLAFEEV